MAASEAADAAIWKGAYGGPSLSMIEAPVLPSAADFRDSTCLGQVSAVDFSADWQDPLSDRCDRHAG